MSGVACLRYLAGKLPDAKVSHACQFPDPPAGAIRQNLHPVHAGNADPIRHPGLFTVAGRSRERLRVAMARMARAFGLCDLGDIRWGALAKVTAHSNEFERAYERLADEDSRTLMVQLTAYRVLGHRRYRLAVAQRYRDALADAGRARLRVAGTHRDALIGVLDEFDLTPFGAEVALQCHRTDIAHTWLMQQYRFERGGHQIGASPGETVIDCGGCWGDTALYFAHRVGPEGSVICYEFEPGNLAILHRNLALNPELAERIRVFERAVWSNDASTLRFSSNSVATTLSEEADEDGGDKRVCTDSIDAMVEREGLARVDFIKMDIEGAEMEALAGAVRTISRHRPKLAISAYHRPDDIWRLSGYIDGLGLGYRFRLDHFTIHEEETVLFCDTANR